MRIITDLKPQKRAKNRVNVFLDGEFAFGLALQHSYDLKVGQALSAMDVARWRSVDEADQAYYKALRFLEHRPRSVAEVSRRLSLHGLPTEVVQEVLQRLAKVKLIDDASFAAFWLENRSNFRPRGRRALRMELRRKGVLDEVIEAVLEDVDELESARRAACDKADRLRGLPVSEQRRKLLGFLARRGFEYDIINDVIEEMNSENYDSEE